MTRIDAQRLEVVVGGVVHHPSRRIYAVILYLAAHPGFVRTADQILEAIGSRHSSEHAARSVIKRARQVVGDHIETRTGLGYAWRGPVEITGIQ